MSALKIKGLYTEKIKWLEKNLSEDYLDELFQLEIISLWQYDFLVDQIKLTTRTDKQQAAYDDNLKRVARKLVLHELKQEKDKDKK